MTSACSSGSGSGWEVKPRSWPLKFMVLFCKINQWNYFGEILYHIPTIVFPIVPYNLDKSTFVLQTRKLIAYSSLIQMTSGWDWVETGAVGSVYLLSLCIINMSDSETKAAAEPWDMRGRIILFNNAEQFIKTQLTRSQTDFYWGRHWIKTHLNPRVSILSNSILPHHVSVVEQNQTVDQALVCALGGCCVPSLQH